MTEQARRPPVCVAEAANKRPRLGPAPSAANATWPRPMDGFNARDASAFDPSTSDGLGVTKITPNKPAVGSSAQRSASADGAAQRWVQPGGRLERRGPGPLHAVVGLPRRFTTTLTS